MRVYKEFWLQAAHQLVNLPASHPCSRVHGHNYKIRLEVTGDIDPTLGWIIDYADIESVWMEHVHSKLDHRNLNEALAVLDGNTTCENLCLWMWDALTPYLPGLLRIEIQEEPTSGCIYEG